MPTPFRNFFRSLLAALVFGSFAAAQSGQNTLTLAYGEEPDPLDPQRTSTAVTGLVMRYAGDTILTKDLTGAYADGLAESWAASEDGLTWTFRLKPDVTFHDGTPLDASAVRDSILRALDPATQSPIAGSLFAPVTDIEVVDARTFRIQLESSFAPFLDNLTDPRGAIVQAAAAVELGADFGRKPVMSGPWRVEAWESGERIVLVRNDDYAWGPSYTRTGAPRIERIVFRIVPEAATRAAAFEAGEAQVVMPFPVNDVPRFLDDARFEMVSFLRKGIARLMEMNVLVAPFDDVRVRRAMNHAIDASVMVDVVLEGRGVQAYGVLPPSIWGYWEGIEDYAPSYDPDAALALLAEAGWTPDASGTLRKDGAPLTFTLLSPPFDDATRSAQIVQQQLAGIGVDMKIETIEFGTLLELAQEGTHQANLIGYTYANPDIVHLWFHSSNIGTGLAHSHFDSPELDALIERSRVETDEAVRLEAYADIQRFVADQALWVPFYINDNYIATSASLEGEQVHPDGFLLLNDASLD